MNFNNCKISYKWTIQILQKNNINIKLKIPPIRKENKSIKNSFRMADLLM